MKNAISVGKEESAQFLSSYFLRKSGKNRFILNLKNLNTFLEAPHFKKENIKNVLSLLNKNDYMASLDIKDSFFSNSNFR